MDEITRCRNQLTSFRIKELKDVLTRLGLPKQGKKQVLMDKILAVLGPPEWPYPKGWKCKTTSVTKEEAAKVIDDIYRKLRGPGAVELASGPKSVAPTPGTVKSEVHDEAPHWEFRCPCGGSNNNKDADLIQCDNTDCGVWQHLSCVVIPEKVAEGAQPETPAQFYCESCRISMGDPFCVTQSQPLYATKLTASPGIKMDTSGIALHSAEKTFALSKSDREVLHKPNHDLQVWCLLLNDKVPYRMHWPAYADLRVNSVPVRVTTRTGTQLLGINGRDDGPSVFTCTREGTNRVSLAAYDARPFCIGVRIIRRRTVEQVRNMVPSVFKGESLEDSLARVRRSINGGCGDAAEDSDSDLEVVSDSVTFSLSCPMSGSRISTAGRFKPCTHMGGFDLNTFIELNQRTRKWQCPICMKNYTVKELIVDPFFNKVAVQMKEYGEDVKEVELKADGSWRPRLEGDARSREPWRSVDGTLPVPNGIHKPVPGPVKLEEGVSPERTSLKIGLKRTHGQWVVNRNSNNAPRKVARQERSFSRSTSATDSANNNADGYDDEGSVNQGISTERTADNGVDSHGSGSKSKVVFLPAPAPPQEGIIVLSDSDEESGAPAAGPNPYGGVAAKLSAQRAASSDRTSQQHQHQQQEHEYANGSAAVQVFRHPSREEDDPAWEPYVPPYAFLSPEGVPSSDYGLNAQAAEEDVEDMVQDIEQGMEDYETTQYLNDDDPSALRLFLPPQPARAPSSAAAAAAAAATAAREEEALDDSWFELRLGGGSADNGRRRRPLQRLERPGYPSRDSLANTASVLLGLNNNSGSGACFGLQWDSK